MDVAVEVEGLASEVLRMAVARAESVGLQGNTLARHKAAINAFEDVLNGSRKRMVRPGLWIGKYNANGATSTVTSNMKFLAAILDWAVEQGHEEADLFQRLARAIRCALAVRAA